MTTLDHVGLIVPRLDEAARLFRALGFTLTSRAEHTRFNPEGFIESAGSAQHSVMLEDGYIELQEITDQKQRHLLSPAASKYFGLHIMAFGVPDAEAAHDNVQANGLAVGPVLRWGRAIAEPDAAGEARFAFFVADYDMADDALLCWVEHLTPDLVRSPRLTTHENGARALGGVTVAARDPKEAARLQARYVAAGGRQAAGGSNDVLFGSARITVSAAAALPPHVRAAASTASPSVAGLLLRMDDPESLAARARAEGLEATREGATWFLDLGRDYGVTLLLRAG